LSGWVISAVSDHGAPSRALPVGVVASSPVYVGDAVDATTGAAFFVFKTGPAFTTFNVNLTASMGTVDFAHVHDGAGLMFGGEIAPRLPPVAGFSHSWVLQTNHVYLLEVHMVGGRLF
jgi:hypothetical protein